MEIGRNRGLTPIRARGASDGCKHAMQAHLSMFLRWGMSFAHFVPTVIVFGRQGKGQRTVDSKNLFTVTVQLSYNGT